MAAACTLQVMTCVAALARVSVEQAARSQAHRYLLEFNPDRSKAARCVDPLLGLKQPTPAHMTLPIMVPCMHGLWLVTGLDKCAMQV